MTKDVKNKSEGDMAVGQLITADCVSSLYLFILIFIIQSSFIYQHNFSVQGNQFQKAECLFLICTQTSASQCSQNSQCPVNALQPFLVESFLIDSTEANPISAQSLYTYVKTAKFKLFLLNFVLSTLDTLDRMRSPEFALYLILRSFNWNYFVPLFQGSIKVISQR